MLDIYDVLTHRCFSILFYGEKLLKEGMLDQYRYCLAKNSLDLMIVLLVEEGHLVSGFLQRLKELEKLQLDLRYTNYFRYCLSIKYGEVPTNSYSIDEMLSLFVEITEIANSHFKSKPTNLFCNFKSICRRRLGIAKRAILAKRIVFSRKRHFLCLLCCLKNKSKLQHKSIVNNYVLHGYPIPNE